MVLPSIIINSINGNGLICSYQQSPWISENWLGYLFDLDGTFYFGRFSKINIMDKICTFTLKDSENANFTEGQSLYYIDGYYGDMLELVLNNKHYWNERVFVSRDSVEVRKGVFRKRTQTDTNDSITVSAGWDHEHCSFCMDKIGNGGKPIGYQNQNDEWVCGDCYNKYIEKYDLSFIPKQKDK